MLFCPFNSLIPKKQYLHFKSMNPSVRNSSDYPWIGRNSLSFEPFFSGLDDNRREPYLRNRANDVQWILAVAILDLRASALSCWKSILFFAKRGCFSLILPLTISCSKLAKYRHLLVSPFLSSRAWESQSTIIFSAEKSFLFVFFGGGESLCVRCLDRSLVFESVIVDLGFINGYETVPRNTQTIQFLFRCEQLRRPIPRIFFLFQFFSQNSVLGIPCRVPKLPAKKLKLPFQSGNLT